MNSYQVRMNQPYFQQLPPLINPKHPPVAPQNPQTIYYLPNGNYIIADCVQSESLACMQPKDMDATIANFQHAVKVEGQGESAKKVQEWNPGCLRRRRKRWYMACVLVTVVVLGVVGGFVGYLVGRQHSFSSQSVMNPDTNENKSKNNTNIQPTINENKTIDYTNNTNINNNNTSKDWNGTNNSNNPTPIPQPYNNNNTTTTENNSPYQNNSSATNNSTTTTNSTTNMNYTTIQNNSNSGYNSSINLSSKEYICSSNPILCSNIPQQVMNYIFSTYSQSNKIKSVLQLSNSFSLISTYQSNVSSALTRQNYTNLYKNITSSVQCMSYTLPNNYSQVYNMITSLQFTTQSQLEAYLNMTEAFSGQPIKLTNSSNLAQSCQFSLNDDPSSTITYRLLQGNDANVNVNCVQNQSQVLLYIDGNGYAPNAVVQSLKKIQETLMGNTSTAALSNNAIMMSMWRKDTYLGFINSIVPGFEQFLAQSSTSIPSRLSTYIALKLMTSLCKNISSFPSDYPKQTFLKLINYYTRKTVQSLTSNQSMQQTSRHKQFIVQQLNEGKKVVILAHGEGAVYANKVFSALDSVQKQSVGMVFAAPAAKTMADSMGSYMSNPSDLILQYFKTYALSNSTFPLPLTANLNAAVFPQQQDFGTNHYLSGYLASYKQKFIQLISSIRSRLLLPPALFSSAPLTVTLLWDTQPDIDLHIYEPGQVHVFYQNRRGTNGYLDADDTFMFGPEHYYAGCGLQQGNYTIKLNYYSGVSPTNVVVTVVAGNQYLIKPMQLYPPIGNAGNSNPPHHVSTVNVNYNPQTNSNQFRITQ